MGASCSVIFAKCVHKEIGITDSHAFHRIGPTFHKFPTWCRTHFSPSHISQAAGSSYSLLKKQLKYFDKIRKIDFEISL